MSEKHSFDTLKVRAGYKPSEHQYAVSVPIYQTTSFELGDVARAGRLLTFNELGYLYSRIGNPTTDVLEQRIAALDGATGAVAVSSGMAAVSFSLLNTVENGGRILTTPQLYGGTFDSFKKLYPGFGIQVDIAASADDPESFHKALRPETKAIFVESISNPNGVIADLRGIADVAHEHGIPLIVDNTFATPYLLNPFEHGADIVIYSLTKGLTGHGNIIGGIVLENGKFTWDSDRYPQFSRPEFTLRDSDGNSRSYLDVMPKTPFTGRLRLTHVAYLGSSLSPLDAYLALIGIETLSERIQKQVANTEAVLRYLESNNDVAWVRHPLANTSPNSALVSKYLPKGAGTVLTFGIRGSVEQSEQFIDATKLFSYQANVGDARSLIINSPKTTHGELTDSEQQSAAIPPGAIRLSIGLEDPADLIADLEQAFQSVFQIKQESVSA